MSEWLDLMLEEIRRKQQEADEARAEQQKRESGETPAETPGEPQSK